VPYPAVDDPLRDLGCRGRTQEPQVVERVRVCTAGVQLDLMLSDALLELV